MKRIISLFFASLMILTSLLFTACKEDNGGGVSTDPLGKYNPKITLTYGKPFNADLMTLINNNGWTTEDNIWVKYIEDELGIKLRLELSTSSSDEYFTRLTGAIASNTFPDFAEVGYFGQGFINLKALHDNNVLADITETVDKYASKTLKDTITAAGKEPFMPCTFDGKLMGFPCMNALGGASYAFYWIRQDWLDALKLEVPKTFEDILKVAAAFTNQDPDGDGIDNTFGFAVDGDFSSFSSVFNAYHAYPSVWIEKDGKLEYGSVQPEMKQALATLQNMYNNGYFRKDFIELSAGSSASQITAGTAGILTSVVTAGFSLATTHIRNENAEFVCIPIMSADSEPVKAVSPIGAYSFYAVNKECKYPEAFIKMLNLHIKTSLDNDLAIKYCNDINGQELWKLSPCMTLLIKDDSIQGQWSNSQKEEIMAALSARSDTGLTTAANKVIYKSIVDYLDNGVMKNWGWNALFGENGSLWRMNELRDKNFFICDKYVAAPTNKMNESKDSLDQLQYYSLAEIIAGEKQVDAFDIFVTEWYANGGTEITAEANAWYDTVK